MQYQATIDSTSRRVLVWGSGLGAPTDPSVEMVSIPDVEAPKLHQVGVKTLGQDGVITVTALDPTPEPEPGPTPPTRAEYTALRDQLIASNEVMDEVLSIVFGG